MREKEDILFKRAKLEVKSYYCRPMQVTDFGIIECVHWKSTDHVQDYIEKQNIASMLVFEGSRYLGQLYLKEFYLCYLVYLSRCYQDTI